MKLIVGLGNPGPRHADSRHNVGFRVVDQLARQRGVPLAEERFLGSYREGFLGSERLGFLKPATFMNLSGHSIVAAVAGLPELALSGDLLVVYDDLDLPLGRIRLRPGGGGGGHNGISHVIECLGTQGFARLRFGIGRPPAGQEVIDFVLDSFSPDEEARIVRRIPTACEAVISFLAEGADVAMSRFNVDLDAADP